jgi:hypothetical protein
MSKLVAGVLEGDAAEDEVAFIASSCGAAVM